MNKTYDVIIVGAGPAGLNIAKACNENGLTVAVIESRGFGGTCPLRGCNPKKVLAHAANLIAQMDRLDGKGIRGTYQLDWQDLMAFKRTFTEPVSKNTEAKLNKRGIATYCGKASFISKNEIQVHHEILKGKHIVIATGAKPAPLPIDGAEHLLYSDDFLELEQLPKKLIFVGGGYIAFEFAHIAARAGSEVHIIQRGNHVLKQFDKGLTTMLVEASEKLGIQVHVNTEVIQIEKQAEGFIVKGKQEDEEVAWQAECVIHGAGRVPAIDTFALEKANVAFDKKGIVVNEALQSTSNPSVFAAGDVTNTEGLPLTPVAQLEARIVSDAILNKRSPARSYYGSPAVVFTTPKLAMAGISVEAAEKEDRYSLHTFDLSEWFTYRYQNEETAFAKVIQDKETGVIVGAHLLSNQADELINYFAMAIQLKLPIKDLQQVMYVYPTATADLSSMLKLS
ncbi:dihydrolipoyl dehydrogenase family protein [Virgibacillus sp. MG-45]|uniref:dihydrolipoyl dehydrogenase family protein n=1 Tax=Virgibacillus sp. MG-45 TaxID=3102791 RepID=UPI002ED99743